MSIYQFERRQNMSEKTIQSEEIRGAVRQRYGQIARDFDGAAASCCGPSDCCGDSGANVAMVEALYEAADVAELPFDVTGMSLGCGDPVTLATLGPGQTVLDLGSGGGIDCFLAAKQVGPRGHVIGVDMTADMLEKARANARNMGVENVEFRLGEIEHLPVADETVDVVISNCVINLSPDKPQVFREAYRALRPGGRLAVSDIVTRVELPEEVKQDLGSWASCVAGAWVDKEYVGAIEAAGFVDVTIEEKALDDAIIEDAAAQLELEIDPTVAKSVAYSARVTARKPD
jgi:ubiquinone/menaquinone biosynthesis C-methylase UbiE